MRTRGDQIAARQSAASDEDLIRAAVRTVMTTFYAAQPAEIAAAEEYAVGRLLTPPAPSKREAGRIFKRLLGQADTRGLTSSMRLDVLRRAKAFAQAHGIEWTAEHRARLVAAAKALVHDLIDYERREKARGARSAS